MSLFALASFPLEQVRDHDALAWRLGQWFAGRTSPARLLVTSRPFDMRPAIHPVQRDLRALRELARAATPLLEAYENNEDIGVAFDVLDARDIATLDAHCSQALGYALSYSDADPAAWEALLHALYRSLWPLPWQREMIRFYEAMGESHARGTTYTMVTWERGNEQASAIAATLRHATGREVQEIDALPRVIDGRYRERATYLEPEQLGLPYLTVLVSYDMRGQWDVGSLHPLLDTAFISLAIDVATVPRNAAMRAVELAYQTAKVLSQDTRVKDTATERKLADAERVMHELTRQGLHDVMLGVLVGAESKAALDMVADDVSKRLGSSLRLMRPRGVQGELLHLWSTKPASQINAPLKYRNMLSVGVGCLMGVLGFHRAQRTDGLLWGFDRLRSAPLFYDLFTNEQGGKQAAHMVVLGKTGYGKTWFLNQVTVRGAALGGYRIIGVDAFKNGERIEAAVGAGGVCHSIGVDSVINILDIAYEGQDWLAQQTPHVIGQLALLLGAEGEVERRGRRERTYIARTFSAAERGLLSRALGVVYRDISPTTPPSAMPTLTRLMEVLATFTEHEAVSIARDLRLYMFGAEDPLHTTPTDFGRYFNGHSTVVFDFGRDINYFDFSGVPDILRPFYYAQCIGAIHRYMRRQPMQGARKTLLIIDEFGYASQVQAVARLAADICKVARKYSLGLLVVDQNPGTFLDAAEGLEIFENAVGKILFHLDDFAARRMGEAISDMTGGHIKFLSEAQPGECIGVFGNDVYLMGVETNPRETRAFGGS